MCPVCPLYSIESNWNTHCVVMTLGSIPREGGRQRKSGVLMVSLMDAGHVTAVDLLLWPQLIRAQLQHINSRWIAHRPWDGFSSESSRPVKICSSGPVPARFHTPPLYMTDKKMKSSDEFLSSLQYKHTETYGLLESREKQNNSVIPMCPRHWKGLHGNKDFHLHNFPP